MATKRLDLILGARDRATSVLGKVQARVRGFIGSVASLPTLITGAIGGAALIGGAKRAIDAYATQEEAIIRLRQALTDAGDAGASSLPQLMEFASGLQAVTTQGDEATLGLAAYLSSLGRLSGQELQDATRATLGLAAATGQNAQTMARAYLNALNGNFTMLQRYVPAVRTATTEQAKMAAVQELVARGMNQMQAQAQTTGGRIQQFKNAWGDLLELIGAELAPVVDLVVTNLNTGLEAGGRVVSFVRGAVTVAVASFAAIEYVVSNWSAIWQRMFLAAGLKVVGFVADIQHFFGTVLPELIGWFGRNWQDVFANLFVFTTTIAENLSNNLRQIFSEVWDFIRSGGRDEIQLDLTPVTEGFRAAFRELPEIAERETTLLEQILGGQIAELDAKLGDGMFAAINQRLEQLREARDRIGDELSGGGGGGGGGGASPESADTGSSSGRASRGLEAVQVSAAFQGIAQRENVQREQLEEQRRQTAATQEVGKKIDKLMNALMSRATKPFSGIALNL